MSVVWNKNYENIRDSKNYKNYELLLGQWSKSSSCRMEKFRFLYTHNVRRQGHVTNLD